MASSDRATQQQSDDCCQEEEEGDDWKAIWHHRCWLHLPSQYKFTWEMQRVWRHTSTAAPAYCLIHLRVSTTPALLYKVEFEMENQLRPIRYICNRLVSDLRHLASLFVLRLRAFTRYRRMTKKGISHSFAIGIHIKKKETLLTITARLYYITADHSCCWTTCSDSQIWSL